MYKMITGQVILERDEAVVFGDAARKLKQVCQMLQEWDKMTPQMRVNLSPDEVAIHLSACADLAQALELGSS